MVFEHYGILLTFLITLQSFFVPNTIDSTSGLTAWNSNKALHFVLCVLHHASLNGVFNGGPEGPVLSQWHKREFG